MSVSKPGKGRLWKSLVFTFCVVGPLAAWVAFGRHGLLPLYKKEKERQEVIERIERLRKENQALRDQILRLREDTDYIEYVIRKELNFLKKGEKRYEYDEGQPGK